MLTNIIVVTVLDFLAGIGCGWTLNDIHRKRLERKIIEEMKNEDNRR